MSTPEPQLGRPWAPSISSQIDLSRPDPSTGWVWLVVLLPGSPFLLALLVIMGTGPIPVALLWTLLALGELLTVAAAFADARRLRERGIADVASARWAVLPFLYLWKRAHPFRDHFVGRGPFWIHLVVLPVTIAFCSFWAGFLTR